MPAIKPSHLALVLMLLPMAAQADLAPLDESYFECAHEGDQTLSLLTLPNGMGNPFTEAYLPDGTKVDATITLYLRNYNYEPIAYYPSEDIWFGFTDFGMVACTCGTHPDSNTDAQGVTTWTNPLSAGGYSMGTMQIFVNGSPLETRLGRSFYTNSPDINGDLEIGLADVSLFTIDYYGTYHYRSDFHYDGNINIADVGILAVAMGTGCP